MFFPPFSLHPHIHNFHIFHICRHKHRSEHITHTHTRIKKVNISCHLFLSFRYHHENYEHVFIPCCRIVGKMIGNQWLEWGCENLRRNCRRPSRVAWTHIAVTQRGTFQMQSYIVSISPPQLVSQILLRTSFNRREGMSCNKLDTIDTMRGREREKNVVGLS
jgi:hypothetical protein